MLTMNQKLLLVCSLTCICKAMLAGDARVRRGTASLADCSVFLVDPERSETMMVDMPRDWGLICPAQSAA